MNATIERRSYETADILVGLLLLGEAIACLVFAAAHLGGPLPLGFATLHEPRVLPATIVEALCGVALGLAAVELLMRRARALSYALWAQVFSVAGFLLGVFASLRGGGSGDPVNDAFHRVMLVLFVLGIAYTAVMRRRAGAAQ